MRQNGSTTANSDPLQHFELAREHFGSVDGRGTSELKRITADWLDKIACLLLQTLSTLHSIDRNST